ncbi:MAG TPA: hypothetical protein VK255_02475, partial [Patescibacteria group bacterium]|nr:hypothetical protein [Patescibacteria group bacterium]
MMETSVIGLDVVAALHREYDQLPESEAHKKYVEFRNIVKSAARKATTQEASRLWKLHEELKKTKQEIEREKKMKIETGCLPECPLPGNDFHVLNGIATCDHCGSKWQLDTSRRCKEEEFIATILYARPS